VAEEAVVLVRVQNLEEDSGYFRAGAISLEPGQRCVVEHGGLRLGVVMGILETGEAISEQLERVIRKAMPVDLDVFARNLADADEVLSATREAVSRNGLPMHLVAAEYTLDRSYLRICFTAPHRVDFRGLLRELAARYGVRIELRQMGARDEARLKGGVGRCGRVVSPERITGICGRLMCCLAYEHEAYKREIGRMPKLGMWVAVGEKRGKVIAHSIFRESVTILTDEQERIEVNAASVEVLPAAKRVKR